MRRELARLVRRLRPCAGEAPEPVLTAAPEREPERLPLPEADATGAVPAFTAGEEDRLRVLAERLRYSAGTARELGEGLADRLRLDHPDVTDEVLARVLLTVGAYLGQVTEDQDAYTALAVTVDAVLGAPPVLAELELALAERDSRW
jgi:hypothetical protein